MVKFEFFKTEHRKVFQRFEAKYIISELEAETIKDYMEPYVFPDPHGVEGAEYPVSSLYLDSRDLRMFWSSETGEKNRFKLRIRTYTDNPSDPVFFEIKRRIDRIIRKQRAGVARKCVGRILHHDDIGPDMLVWPDDKEMENLYQFRDYMDMFAAIPCVMVRYRREAYMSNLEEPVRITCDRHLTCLPVERYTPEVWSCEAAWRDLSEVPLILEIKFTDVVPFWLTQLVQRFHLSRDSFAKYVNCVKALKRDGIRVGGLLESTAI